MTSMDEQQRFVVICNRKIKNMAWYSQKRVSTAEGILERYTHFLGYIKALYDIGAIAEGRYWYYRSCVRGIVNKYAYEKEGIV